MKRCMLDTNTVSHLLRGHPRVAERVVEAPMAALCVSAVTEGELSFGLAKRPESTRLQLAVGQFLRRVDVLPWDTIVAKRYGTVRAEMARQGKTLGPLDLLIAAHALAIDAILVTSDRAFGAVTDLHVEDWTS
jgi:tRNA(fMet)-specific endonuclease VapC